MKTQWKICEFLGLYVLIPLLMLSGLLPRNPLVLLIPMFLLMLFLLRADPSFQTERFFNIGGAAENLKQILIRIAIVLPFIILIAYLLAPDQFLAFPRQRPFIWLMVMFLYPLFSAYPQEIIFRAFLFHRYGNIFTALRVRIFASAMTFGFVHIIFGHWLSVVLSFLGGILLARTYAESRSLLLVSIEHAIYGNAIFTFGLGQYFYHAAFRP